MAVPSVATYSVAALVAAHEAFKTLLDAGAGAAVVKVRDSSDVLLATLALTDPCGTVNGTTGQLTLGIGADGTASASGTAAYGELCDSNGTVHLALPVQSGSAPVTGRLVLNTTSFVSGGPVRLVSATIG